MAYIQISDMLNAIADGIGRSELETNVKDWLEKKKKRSRNEAGKNEKDDITFLVNAIHTRNSAGLKLIEAFKTRFGLDILDAKARSGNRSVHYDFSVLVGPSPGIWKNVEHKGSKDYTPILPNQTPWAAGVQFHNGGCEKYTIAKEYARLWYDIYIGSGEFKREWKLESEIPSFETWFQQDAKAQGNPKTKFGLELKSKVKAAGTHLRDKRDAVNQAFNPSEESLTRFKQEAQAILNDALEQKDYWLTIHGDLNSHFHCAWYPKFKLGTIQSVKIRKELDIQFDFVSDVCKFSAYLRWGKGAGFSNIRIDPRDNKDKDE